MNEIDPPSWGCRDFDFLNHFRESDQKLVNEIIQKYNLNRDVVIKDPWGNDVVTSKRKAEQLISRWSDLYEKGF